MIESNQIAVDLIEINNHTVTDGFTFVSITQMVPRIYSWLVQSAQMGRQEGREGLNILKQKLRSVMEGMEDQPAADRYATSNAFRSLIVLACEVLIVSILFWRAYATMAKYFESTTEETTEEATRSDPTSLGMFSGACVWAMWASSSVGITIVNKHVMSKSQAVSPTQLSWYHQFLTFVVLNAVRFSPGPIRSVFMQESSKDDKRSFFGVPLSIVLPFIIPCAMIGGAGLVTCNVAADMLSVTHVQALRASKPLLMFVVAAICGYDAWSVRSTICVLGAVIGACLVTLHGSSVAVVGTPVAIGVTIYLISIGCDIARVFYLKTLVSIPRVDPGAVLCATAPVQCLFLLPAVLAEGMPNFGMMNRWDTYLSGMAAVSLNICTLLVLRLSSPTTYAVAGALVMIALFFLDHIVFNTVLSSAQYIGLGLVTVFSLAYIKW
jgi:hypothetical protein